MCNRHILEWRLMSASPRSHLERYSGDVTKSDVSDVRFCGVSADRAAAPSGVVTFLFTDVEGSTRRWEADADEMRATLPSMTRRCGSRLLRVPIRHWVNEGSGRPPGVPPW